MARGEFSEGQMLAHVAYRPRYLIAGVVSIDEDTKPIFSNIRAKAQSSVGQLDSLPLEVLWSILNYLDLQSLSRLSSVSGRGHEVVRSLPAFAHLLKFAGQIFKALGQTQTIHLHSVSKLDLLLYCSRCASCGLYGEFLFLLSAERCCHACLDQNQSLWLITMHMAQDMFGLTKQQFNSLPVLRSIPGEYFVYHNISRKRRQRLTSVKAVKESALRTYGSHEALNKVLTVQRAKQSEASGYLKYRWYQEAPLYPCSKDPLTLGDDGRRPDDDFCGMGAVLFPSISPQGMEMGIWCRGCEKTFAQFHSQDLGRGIEAKIVPQGCSSYYYLLGMQYRVRSTADFLEHTKQCHPANDVIMKEWKGLF